MAIKILIDFRFNSFISYLQAGANTHITGVKLHCLNSRGSQSACTENVHVGINELMDLRILKHFQTLLQTCDYETNGWYSSIIFKVIILTMCVLNNYYTQEVKILQKHCYLNTAGLCLKIWWYQTGIWETCISIIINNRKAGEIIRLVASVSPSVHPSMIALTLEPFDLIDHRV